jgi:hypothetical protein
MDENPDFDEANKFKHTTEEIRQIIIRAIAKGNFTCYCQNCECNMQGGDTPKWHNCDNIVLKEYATLAITEAPESEVDKLRQVAIIVKHPSSRTQFSINLSYYNTHHNGYNSGFAARVVVNDTSSAAHLWADEEFKTA